jgi:hypothetical protein
MNDDLLIIRKKLKINATGRSDGARIPDPE